MSTFSPFQKGIISFCLKLSTKEMFTFKHFFLINFHCLTYSALQRKLLCSLSWNTTGWQKLRGGTGGPAEKFGLGRKFQARTYAILSRIKICCDLRTFFLRSLGKKVPFWVKNSVSWARSALLHGIYRIFD